MQLKVRNAKGIQDLVTKCVEEQSVLFYVYTGQTRIKNKKCHRYMKMFVRHVEGDIYEFPDNLDSCKGFTISNKIEGSYSVGVIVAAISTPNAVFSGTGLSVSTWHNKSDIGFWQSEQENLRYKELVAAEMKSNTFSNTMENDLKDIKQIFKSSNGPVRQMIIAKIINHLNN